MKFCECEIPGAWIIDPSPHMDHRGHFMRSWCSEEFAEHGIEFQPLQSNVGFNICKGTLRGMHYQIAPALEAKLVRCTRGSLFDVVVDLRADSPTYLRWQGVQLSADNGRSLLVPEGCAHGYQTLEDASEIHYLTSALYAPDSARGARYDDPAFAIRWPLEVSAISEQDRNWPLIAQREAGETPQ